MSEWGFFPFGRPNSVRPARPVERPEVVVISSYPRTWHVQWCPPAALVENESGARGSLAVDVEPWPYTDGEDFASRLALWKEEVGFIEGKHGTLARESPPTNRGPREKIVRDYLGPLGIAEARAIFTAVHPVYLAGVPRNGRDPHGEALAEYNRFAAEMGLLASTIPERPPRGKLPQIAAARFGAQLIAELSAASPPLIVTLGERVWRTLVELPSLHARPPAASFSRLRGGAYGTRGSLTVNGRAVPWLPLIKPVGLKDRPLDGAAPESLPPDCWEACHRRWAAALEENRIAKRAAKKARVAARPRAPILPEGSSYRLTIARARLVERRSVPLLEVIFRASEGPRDAPARGQFPLAGPGLSVLVSAALGEPQAAFDAALAERLEGRELIADVIHGGTGGHSLALVRNIRPLGATAPLEAPALLERPATI